MIHVTRLTDRLVAERSRVALRLVLASLVLASVSLIADDAAERKETAREALAKLNVVIGEWRGVGQPRRGSNRGAWSETSGWVWDLQQEAPALVQTVVKGKLVESMRLEYDTATGEYSLTVESPDGGRNNYRGGWVEDQLVLTAEGNAETPARRMTITPRSDIRLVVLHEATEPGRDLFFRVAEVGYTRKGKRLAGAGGGQPQCIVTGGLGTMEVTYKGETYYVCCTGCRQAFEDDPEGILADYRERLKEEQAERAGE